MNITTENDNGLCRMRIEGEMTIFTADELKKHLFEKLEACSGLDLDLSQVSEMDTAGFQLLFLTKREFGHLNRPFRIVAQSPVTLSVLKLYNINMEGA